MCVCVCVSSGCCSEVPANSPAWCWESVWCQTPQVSLPLKTHTLAPYLWSHSGTLTERIYGSFQLSSSFPLGFVKWPSSLCPHTFHPGRVLPSLYGDKNLIKLTYTQGHTLKHTLQFLCMPLTELTISVKPSNKIHLNLLGSFSASWRAKRLEMACLTSLWPRIKLTIYCLAQEMTSVYILHQLGHFLSKLEISGTLSVP